MDQLEGMASTLEDKSEVERIVSEFFAKSLHVILLSRIPDISVENDTDGASHLSSESSSVASSSVALQQSSRSNLWFKLDTAISPAMVRNAEPWRGRVSEPMVVDVVLQQPGGEEFASPSLVGRTRCSEHVCSSREEQNGGFRKHPEGEDSVTGTLLERWVVQYVTRKKSCACGSCKGCRIRRAGGVGSKNKVFKATGEGASLTRCQAVERPVMYKRMVIMLRSLYCTMRLLPAHRLSRLVNSSSRGQSFTLSYRVSSAPFPLAQVDELAMMTCSFTPVETMWGKICVSVNYRHTTAVTALESTPPILPRIIPDYVGSPTTNSLIIFASVGARDGEYYCKEGVGLDSLPHAVPSSPGGPSFARRHSWNGKQNFLRSLASLPSSQATQLRSPSASRSPDSRQSPILDPCPYLSCAATDPICQSLQRSSSFSALPVSNLLRAASLRQNQGGCSSLPISNFELGKPSSRSPSPSPAPPIPSNDIIHGLQSGPVSIPKRFSAWARPDRPSLHSSPADGSPRLHPRSHPPRPAPKWNADDLPYLVVAESKPSISSLHGRLSHRADIPPLPESSLFVSRPLPIQQDGEQRSDGPISGGERSFYGPPGCGTLGRKPRNVDEEGVRDEFSCPFAVDGDEGEIIGTSQRDLRFRGQDSNVLYSWDVGELKLRIELVRAVKELFWSCQALRETSKLIKQTHTNVRVSPGREPKEVLVHQAVRERVSSHDGYIPLWVGRPSLNLTANEVEQTQKMSQDAAVGALVRILKCAPALRDAVSGRSLNSRSPSSLAKSPTSKRNHVASTTGGKVNCIPLPIVRRDSGSTFSDALHASEGHERRLAPKSFAFAWKELRAYLEMRDHLLRQSGAKIRCSPPAVNVGCNGT